MTTQDIALIRELLYRAKDLDLIKDILEFANEIHNLKLEKIRKNSKKFKNIDESIISKCRPLQHHLSSVYLPKLLNDLPDELSESQEVDVLQSIFDDFNLEEVLSKVCSKLYDLSQTIDSQLFSDASFCYDCLNELKIAAQNLDYFTESYERKIQDIEKKLEKDEKIDMVCFNDLEKYGLKFEDGWAVDKNEKKVAQAQNFILDLDTEYFENSYLKLLYGYETLLIDKEGNVFKHRPHTINMIEALDDFLNCSKKLKVFYQDNTIKRKMFPNSNDIRVYDNIIVVHKYDKYGVLDKNGNKIIPIKLTKIYSIRDTKNFIVKRDGKAGIIDDNGKFILDIEFDDIIESYFNYDKYVIALVKGDSVTFVDKNLNEIKEHNFYLYDSRVYEKYSYQDKNLNQVVLDDLYIYKQKGNLYIVKERSKYNEIVMNNKGEILKNIYRGEVEFFGENFYIQKDNDLSIFNDKGEILKSLKCNFCWSLDECLEISLNGKKGIVTPNLDVIEAIYDEIDTIKDFGFNAKLGKKRYLINNNSEIISEHDFDSIRLIWWDNVLLAGDSSHHPFREKCYLLDFNGKILPQSYYFEIPKDYLKG
ncbi:hypothetical protein B9N64_01065 [Campylobacter concisus]|uniref:WG repeat-containing protein n=1 Tax=Campylobacter concisus TaxID=199 RepID=UPI000B3D5415|nr:WG repeat-containing protein [Campylobacter concisus]OUT15938.1 hypothetical protein B9N64_01065 [Campylobacter concisus]